MLLSYASTDPVQHLPEVQKITNNLIFELTRFKDRHSQCTFRTFHDWLRKLYGKNWPEEAPTVQAITKSIDRLGARLCKLKKQHTTAEKEKTISDFLQQEYDLPRLGLCKGRVLHFSPAKKSTCGKANLTSGSQTQEQCVQKCKELRQKMYAVTRNTNK